MGRLQDIIKQRLQSIQDSRNEAAPDPLIDPNEAYAYMQEHNDLRYIERSIYSSVLAQFKTLSQEEQDRFYQLAMSPDKAAGMSLEQFREKLNDAGAKNDWLLSEEIFGKSLDELTGAMEEAMGEEKASALADSIENIKAPRDPEFPVQDKHDYPYANAIADLKNEVPANDPNRQAIHDMLDEVNDELGVLRDDAMGYYDGMDQETDGLPGMTSQMDQFQSGQVTEFIESDEKFGLGERIPKSYDGRKYETSRINTQGLPLEDGEQPGIYGLTIEMPEEMLTFLDQVEEQFDKIGEEKLKDPSAVREYEKLGEQPAEVVYNGEQSVKMYAFWPLIQAKRQLGAAVEGKNIEEIQSAHTAYKNLYGTYQELMGLAQKGAKVFSGNINSTRPGGNDMPEEFVKDYAGHNKVNGLFLLHALSKNLGVPVNDLVTKPIKSMVDGTENYRKKYGLSGKRSLGSKLCRGLSNYASGQFLRGLDANRLLVGRALTTVAGIADDKELAAQLAGQAELADTFARKVIDKEDQLWDTLTSASADKRRAIYGQAALLPEDEFDLAKMAETLNKTNWKKELSTASLIDRLRKEGKIDYQALKDRTKQVLEDADKQTYVDQYGNEQKIPSRFSSSTYLVSAHRAYMDLIKTATPEEQQREDFKAFKEHVLSMHELTENEELKVQLAEEELAAGLIDQHAFDLRMEPILAPKARENGGTTDMAMIVIQAAEPRLTMEKKGFFLSSTNSTEHQKMTAAVHLLDLKLKVLRGETNLEDLTPKEQQDVSRVTLREAAVSAWNQTYAYVLKSDKNGTKTEWEYPVGSIRNKAAKETLKGIKLIIDDLKLATPAERQKLKLRTEVHDKRGDKEWMRRNLKSRIARDLYIMTIHYNKTPAEKQERLLEEETMKRNIKEIQKDEAFKRMFENHSLDSLAEKLIVGKGALSAAYIDAQKQIAKEEGLVDPVPGKKAKNLTTGEVGEFWSKQEITEAEPDDGLPELGFH